MATICRGFRYSSKMLDKLCLKQENGAHTNTLMLPARVPGMLLFDRRGVHWDVKTSAGAKDFVMHLDSPERKILLSELQRLETERRAALAAGTKVRPVPMKQLRAVAMFNAVPFVGFGILDNVIMITAGEYIDTTFGAVLGISTMAAAAFGNMVSDVAGVGTAGFVENLVSKLGVKPPDISAAQADMKGTRWASSIGRAIGVSIGCLIGMFPLLFFNEAKIIHQKEELISHKHKDEIESSKKEK